MSSSLKTILKNEIVLEASLLLAIISSFIVHPDRRYFSYIDYRTLSILLSLMLIMAGLQALSVFRQIGELLVTRMHSARGVVVILTGLCFFASMFITNDVSLITFVPFTIVTLTIAGQRQLLIPVIVLETIAANLGSMATPIGNPQNLYLYSLAGLSISQFLLLMLPYTAFAAVLLVAVIFLKVKPVPVQPQEKTEIERTRLEWLRIVLYCFCFAVSLLVVVRILDYRIGLCIVLVLILLTDRKRLLTADYSLLLTFIFLFIFIGNMKRMPAISSWLGTLLADREVPVSVLLSQVISNVPAAILCSGFTEDLPALILGVNFGGLGTLIASMASLISFKQYGMVQNAKRGSYMLTFTVWNLIFLACMLGLYGLLRLI